MALTSKLSFKSYFKMAAPSVFTNLDRLHSRVKFKKNGRGVNDLQPNRGSKVGSGARGGALMSASVLQRRPNVWTRNWYDCQPYLISPG